ncbi:C40 family peptidase [Polaribacter glomeratus]|uniref:Glycoside hydrolase n=1 Tax=Polaribacter glomeratus TaxID=102 RepID=A0A2S7WIJ2_9FLAO|nr:C40 family peptidase [Polaribacter glomeratus]PQJ77429.1 glycoside hydrolase [Polaribacter glomeratus]TXD66016.1 NlpC/P60 family protein [Polaribacter glomeratus]
MKKISFICLIFLFILSSCGTVSSLIIAPNKEISITDRVVYNALQFEGVKYRRGGVTTDGFDCSGLVYTSFIKENILLPRQSRYMANQGIEVALNQAKKGDLLFFITGRKSKSINHVGLVVSTDDKIINFIHSTNGRGVIISSLSEKYWKNAFLKATKVL